MTPRRVRHGLKSSTSKHMWPENIFQNVAITAIKEHGFLHILLDIENCRSYVTLNLAAKPPPPQEVSC
jgi:hypothetical protein